MQRKEHLCNHILERHFTQHLSGKIIKKFQKLSVNINDSGKKFFFPSISFKELNRFLKSLPLRNNFPLNSPFGINNVRTHFYEVLNGKFRIQGASKKYSFPLIQYHYFISLNKGNKLSKHLYRKLKKKNFIYFGNLPNQDTFSMCLVM